MEGAAPQPNTLIAGRYRIERLLGSGGFGAVYLAIDERLHRNVAIKVCSTRRLPPHEADAAARLFQSEALTLARLRHPGLTAIWDYFNDGTEWYLVMEYVPGETLRDLLRRAAGPLPQAAAIEYARQLCTVLGYLHKQHPPIVFRDLKPANIMVTPEGRLKLIDFGIARLFSPDKTADTAQFGTPGYAPPEQYGGQTEPRSDIYSLGVVLHQMLTGHNPMSTPFALPPVSELNSALEPRLDPVVQRATAYEIDDRIGSADAFCEALDAAVASRAPLLQAQTIATYTPVGLPLRGERGQHWTPTPRALPNRPQGGGVGRGLASVVLVVLLLSLLALGVFVLRGQIVALIDDVIASGPNAAAQSQAPKFTVFTALADGTDNLFVRYDTQQTRQITRFVTPEAAFLPAISPDGSRVAFTKRAADGEKVWVTNLDGTAQRVLLPGYALSRAPAWSPDGKWLALEVAQDQQQQWRDHDVVIVDLQTNTVRPIASQRSWEGGAAWSPDSQRLVFQAKGPSPCMRLYITDINGSTPQPLPALPDDQCTSASGDYWPDWSPDGKYIAFGRKTPSSSSRPSRVVEQVVLLNLDTKAIRAITNDDNQARIPRWSRNGRFLLFEQGAESQTALFSYDRDTQEIAEIDTGRSNSHYGDWF